MRHVWITGAACVIEARGTMRRGTVQSASMDGRRLVLEFDGRIGDWERLLEVREKDGEFRDVLTHEVIKLRVPPPQPLSLVRPAFGQPAAAAEPMQQAVGHPSVGPSAPVTPVSEAPASRPRIIDLADGGNGSSRFRDNRPWVAVGSAAQPKPTSYHATDRSRPLTFSLGEKLNMLQASAKQSATTETPVPIAQSKKAPPPNKAAVDAAQAKAEKVFVFVRDYIREHGAGPRLSAISKATGFSEVMSAVYVRKLKQARRLMYVAMDYRTMEIVGEPRPKPKATEPPPKPAAPPAAKGEASALTPAEQARREKLRQAMLAGQHKRPAVIQAEKNKRHLYAALRDYIRQHKVGPKGPVLMKLTGYNQARVSAYMRELREEGRISYRGVNYTTAKIVRNISPEGRAALVAAGKKRGEANAATEANAESPTAAIVPHRTRGALARGAIVTHGTPVEAHPLVPLREQLQGLLDQWSGQLGALVSLVALFEGKDEVAKPSDSPVGSTALPVPSIKVTEEMVRVRSSWQGDIDALRRVLSALGDRIVLAEGEEG